MGLAVTFIPFFLFCAAWTFAWVQLARSCTFHGHHANLALGPLPFLVFCTYCCFRVLAVYWREAMGEGGWSQYLYRYRTDRFDVIVCLQLGFWLLCMGGFWKMMVAPPLPPNCQYALGPEVSAFEFSPCLACCSCLRNTGNVMRCGFDYCEQRVLTARQGWDAARETREKELLDSGCASFGGLAPAACEALAKREGNRAFAELRAKEGGASADEARQAGHAAAASLAPTPAPTPPTMAPTAAPTPDQWDAAAENDAFVAAIGSGAKRPPPVCWGTGKGNTDALLKGTENSAKKKCATSEVWYQCVFNNCMRVLGPQITNNGAETAVASYPACEEACAYAQKWLQPPVYDERGNGQYDVYATTATPVASTCKAMCWNTEAETGQLGNNNVMVAGNNYNHSMPIPAVSSGGINTMVSGGLLCIAFVGCFTTCFKGRTKAKVMTAAEQKAKWEAAAKADAGVGQGVNKMKQAIADATQADVAVERGGRQKIRPSSKARVVPSTGDLAVDHLPISMKSKHGLARLHRKRENPTLPPIARGAPRLPPIKDKDGDSDEQPETAADVRELACAERKKRETIMCL